MTSAAERKATLITQYEQLLAPLKGQCLMHPQFPAALVLGDQETVLSEIGIYDDDAEERNDEQLVIAVIHQKPILEAFEALCREKPEYLDELREEDEFAEGFDIEDMRYMDLQPEFAESRLQIWLEDENDLKVIEHNPHAIDTPVIADSLEDFVKELVPFDIKAFLEDFTVEVFHR